MMCNYGDDVLLIVPVPAELSYTGEMRWDTKGIDRCIAPIVQALNNAGIYTSNCCCGHGKSDGSILLHDGRELVLKRETSTLLALATSKFHREKHMCTACGSIVYV